MFFSKCVIPLARRVRDIGLSSSFLSCADDNEAEWMKEGHAIVEKMVEQHEGGDNSV